MESELQWSCQQPCIEVSPYHIVINVHHFLAMFVVIYTRHAPFENTQQLWSISCLNTYIAPQYNFALPWTILVSRWEISREIEITHSFRRWNYTFYQNVPSEHDKSHPADPPPRVWYWKRSSLLSLRFTIASWLVHSRKQQTLRQSCVLAAAVASVVRPSGFKHTGKCLCSIYYEFWAVPWSIQLLATSIS